MNYFLTRILSNKLFSKTASSLFNCLSIPSKESFLQSNLSINASPFWAIFTSTKRLSVKDIFFSTKVGDKWAFAKNIGVPVSTPYHDSNLALSADGSTLFKFKDDGGGDIYYSERDAAGVWGEPAPLPGIINSSFAEKSVTIPAGLLTAKQNKHIGLYVL